MFKIYLSVLALMLMAHGIALGQIRDGDCGTLGNEDDCFLYNRIPPVFTMCDEDFALDIYTTGTVTVTIDNPNVIQYINGKIHVVGPGTTTLTIDYVHGLKGHERAHWPIKITVTNALPSVRIDTVIRSCDGQTLTYNPIVQNRTLTLKYQWLVNNINTGVTDSVFTSSTLKNNDVLKCVLITPGKCAPIADSIIVNTGPPIVNIRTLYTSTYCMGSLVRVTAQYYNIGKGKPIAWQWRVNGINVTGTDPTFSSTALNNGDVVDCLMTYINGPQCTETFIATSNPLTISIKPILAPVVSVAASANPVCPGTVMVFTATVNNIGTDPVYQWQVNGVNTGTNSAVLTSGELKNNDIVTCYVGNSECMVPVVSNAVTASFFITPVIKLSRSLNIILGSSSSLKPIITGSIATYSWSPATGLNSTSVAQPIITPTATNTYTLKVVSTDGCQAEASVTINLIVPIIVPNTFTPNGDGSNDNWHIPSLAYYPHCMVNVYSRTGGLVFHSNGYTTDWDGSYNGKPLPLGVYYYVIETESHGAKVTGPVTIIR